VTGLDLPFGELVAVGTAGGFSLGVGLAFCRWLLIFAAGRQDKREAQIDEATQRLISGLERRLDEETKSRKAEGERRDKVEEELRGELGEVKKALDECQRQHADARRELMELKGLTKGLGDAKQHAALIVAAEKQEARK
jgi:hypothetical protein